MARLNDAGGAPADALELLKRKYSRQNKEIARINSSQCIRIRNLENEVSRLLAENLELREQVLRVQNDAESKQAQQIMDHVQNIKTNLETKLLEIGVLVTKLGDEPSQALKQSVKEEKMRRSSPAKSPDQRNWKNTYTLSEAVGLDDGRLPPILEDKSYPRRTLEPDEFMEVLPNRAADNADSPDIGPPPVSNFINEDPVKIDLLSRTEKEFEESSGLDPALSINLEQRRRRKDSTGSQAPKRPSRFEPSPGNAVNEVAQSLKTGAKRKFSTRDEDYGPLNTLQVETSPDDFKYTRRTTKEQQMGQVSAIVDRHVTKSSRDIAVARGLGREKNGTAVISASRKALGPKTTNMDVTNSPRKSLKPAKLDDMPPAKHDGSRSYHAKERVRERRSETIVKQSVEPPPVSISLEVEPETPLITDILSPPASGSSAIGAHSCDTPPPSDLGSGAENHRQSRRARGGVSYALPNLRDKMRRPTNELVDAVTGEGKAQRLSTNKLENDGSTTARKVKEEPGSEDAWKNLPAAASADDYTKSPLIDKVSLRDQQAEAVIPERQRRRSHLHPDNNAELSKSGPSSAISALMTSSRRVKQEQTSHLEVQGTIEGAMAKLDIYEFTGSSPSEASVPSVLTSREERRAAKSSRRLSSMQEMALGHVAETSDGENNQMPASGTSRRRQSMMGFSSSVLKSEPTGRESTDGLKKTLSEAGLYEATESGLRNERLSTRRRSMML